ncbi:uncharacterized protein PHACADRAFT_141917 [Phanerochaete carnosa HHB-10118-sp]|uniref:Uncharacterized protein n=1 Tax=Phanerochaete carnosa (strain HHB-10118-sp) TaxID=650164 RepID=K5X2B0_PHACS|nr:uncharacterized protein PHACADRAFT_141917 [Phanerochaete carnosa HHB-10118-sp]EKM56912.1 hypothetical protein PHACADRAFT_141917 [Phanerochaete carnosa HHB-10118-sp]
MSGRRTKTKSTANPPGKTGQSSKPPQAPPSKPTNSVPAKPTPAPVPPKATSLPAPKQTPSARLRQEWKAFEPWLSARRAERDKQVSDKLKEAMSSKNKSKSKWGKQPAASATVDVGAFEDKLNEELVEKARAEWLRRLGVVGLDEEDWTDITEDEQKVVIAAFTPPERSSQTAEDPSPPPPTPPTPPPPPPQAVAETSKPKPAVINKAGPSQFAARIEEESTIPGAWNAPSPPPVPEQGIMGRNRPYTPMARLAQQAVSSSICLPTVQMGRGVNNGNANSDASPSESLWEAQMKHKISSSDPQLSGGLWDHPVPNTTTKASVLDPVSSKFPTPEALWDMHMRKSTPKPPSPPPVEPDLESLWGKTFGKKASPPAPQLPRESESLWDLQQISQSDGMDWQSSISPTSARTPASSTPASKNPSSSRASASPRSSASSKNFPGKSPLSNSWDVDIDVENLSLQDSTVDFSAPVSSTYTGAYGYISPVFVEMEDEAFPRVLDPLPETMVADSIRSFHSAAAEAEIELRRQMISGALDDSAFEELVNTHMSMVEQYARKIVEGWKQERSAEEQRRLIAEEQKRRLAEVKKQGLARRGGQWAGSSLTEGVARAASPALQAKRPQQTKNRQARLLEESFGARPATPAHLAQAQQDDDGGISLWERRTPGKAAEGRPIPSSFAGSAPQAQPPPQARPPPQVQPSPPTPSPWAQLAKTPARRNPFLPQAAPPPAPEPSLSPWDAMIAKVKQAPPEPQLQDAWEEDNTDESEEGASSWSHQVLNGAFGGAVSAWSMGVSAFGGAERPGTPAQVPAPTRPSAPAPPVPTVREAPWAGEGPFQRSTSHGPTTPEDPRFATWRPPRIVDPDEHENPAKKMQDLALQNLFQSVDDSSDTDLFNAMSMYSKATQSATRKTTTPAARR